MMCVGKTAQTFQIPNFFLLCFVFLRIVSLHCMQVTTFLFRVYAFPEYAYLLKGSCVLYLAKPQSSCFPFPMTKPKPQLVLDLNSLGSTESDLRFSLSPRRRAVTMAYQLLRLNLPLACPIKMGQKQGHSKEEYANTSAKWVHSARQGEHSNTIKQGERSVLDEYTWTCSYNSSRQFLKATMLSPHQVAVSRSPGLMLSQNIHRSLLQHWFSSFTQRHKSTLRGQMLRFLSPFKHFS